MHYTFRNVNEAFPVLWHRMQTDDRVTESPSRNGRMFVALDPVTITYKEPRERVLFLPERDANPFFHMFEAIWMLAGRSDLYWLERFNANMANFSDDGRTIVSDYGRRWREVLPAIVELLRKDPNTRRAYIPIHHPDDIEHHLYGKDIPCNVGVAFCIRTTGGGYFRFLDMTVFNRSNDMVWGSLGANYVHFGFLQEYVAALCEVEVGTYHQVSSCFHVYPDFEICKELDGKIPLAPHDPYEAGEVKRSQIHVLNARTEDAWQEDAKWFMDNMLTIQPARRWWNDPFFDRIAAPMLIAWKLWKWHKDFDGALQILNTIRGADDWKQNAMQWIKRRQLKHESKRAVG